MRNAEKIIKKHLSDDYENKKCSECSRRKFYQSGYEDGKKDNSGWTSVEDGLPEEPKFIDKGYIVQKDLVREPFSAYWDGDIFSDDCGKVIENVIAWRPLPEPYRKDGE